MPKIIAAGPWVAYLGSNEMVNDRSYARYGRQMNSLKILSSVHYILNSIWFDVFPQLRTGVKKKSSHVHFLSDSLPVFSTHRNRPKNFLLSAYYP